MLVFGWTINETYSSSCVSMVGFGASAQKIKSLLTTTSLLGSNKFSPSARRTLGLYDLYQCLTPFHKSNKPTRYELKSTGATVDLTSTPPQIKSRKINNIRYFLTAKQSQTGVTKKLSLPFIRGDKNARRVRCLVSH